MKKLVMFGLGVGLLLASASGGAAAANESRFSHPSRERAAERSAVRKADPQPYALTGSEKTPSWQKQVGPNPSGRPRMIFFKRSPIES